MIKAIFTPLFVQTFIPGQPLWAPRPCFCVAHWASSFFTPRKSSFRSDNRLNFRMYVFDDSYESRCHPAFDFKNNFHKTGQNWISEIWHLFKYSQQCYVQERNADSQKYAVSLNIFLRVTDVSFAKRKREGHPSQGKKESDILFFYISYKIRVHSWKNKSRPFHTTRDQYKTLN